MPSDSLQGLDCSRRTLSPFPVAEMHDQWALSGLAQRLILKAGESARNDPLIRTYSNYRLVRQIVLGAVGVTISLIGVALLVLPGPAILVLRPLPFC